MTQAELGQALTALGWSVDQVMIARIERGQRVTPIHDKNRIAEALNVDPAVLDGDGNPFTAPGMTAWRAQAHLDAARDDVERAAYAYGAAAHGLSALDPDAEFEPAESIARDAEQRGWGDRDG